MTSSGMRFRYKKTFPTAMTLKHLLPAALCCLLVAMPLARGRDA